MPRNIDPEVLTAMATGNVKTAYFLQIEWNGSTLYVWSGIGDYSIDGQTYTGVGQLGSVSTVSETTSTVANGLTLTLSGIDPVSLQDALTQLNHSNWAYVYLGFFGPNGLIGTPILCFAGLTDQPNITIGTDTSTIELSLESRLSDLQRTQNRKYTQQDQNLSWPGDNSLSFIEKIQNLQVFWGQS